MDLTNIPIVKITWHDAQDAESGWLERTDMEDSPLAVCQDVGWLLVDNEEKVVIMKSQIEGEEMGGGCTAIHHSWVQKIEVLEPAFELKEVQGQVIDV